MAYKVLPTDWVWKNIFDELESMTWRRLNIEEIVEEMKSKNDISTTPQKRGRSGFKIQYVCERTYRNQTVRARIFLNVSGATGRVDETKWAYARLEHISSGTYLSSPDILFTEGFPNKIKECARAFKDMVDHWPIDPDCDHFMGFEIIPGVMHVRKFTCKTKKRGHIHRNRREEIYFLDIPVSDKTKLFLNNMFEPFTKRMEKAKSEGKVIKTLRKKRADKNVPRVN